MSAPLPGLFSWPLGGEVGGRLRHAEGDRSVREVMLNILLTRPGERLMRPEFGAGLLDFVHLPNNETTRRTLAGVVRKSLALWEPRVVVESVQALPDPVRLAEVHLNIRYRLRHSSVPQEFSLSLDLEPSS